MKYFFILLLLAGIHFNSHAMVCSSISPVDDCDTIYTIEGKMHLGRIIQQNAEETQFSLCDDPLQKVYMIPSHRISRIAKEKIEHKVQIVIPETKANPAKKSSKVNPLKAKTPSHKRKMTAEDVANDAFWQGILSIVLTISIVFIPVAFFVGMFSIRKGLKAVNMADGHPKAKKIRRRARWAMVLGGISMGLSLAVILLLAITISKWDMDIGRFEFEGNMFGPW